MATIKSYTDISQSKILSKILPLESADGGWYGTDNPFAPNNTFWLHTKYSNKAAFPAWSLAALLSVLPYPFLSELSNGIWKCGCYPSGICNYVTADSPIDACYELILKLHELNLL